MDDLRNARPGRLFEVRLVKACVRCCHANVTRDVQHLPNSTGKFNTTLSHNELKEAAEEAVHVERSSAERVHVVKEDFTHLLN